jgi:hypothetical protein
MRVMLSGLVEYPRTYMDKAPKHVGVRWVGVALGLDALVETSSQLTLHTILQKDDGSFGRKMQKKKRQATVLAVLGLEPRLARIWIGWF